MTEGDFLKSKGYNEWHPDSVYRADGVVYCWKKVPGTEKHQFVIKKWPPLKDGLAPTYELETVVETRNEIWAELKFYGLRYTELCANLDRLEGCLKQALVYMDANPLHYRFDGRN